jgi:hypothetical protein
VVGLVPSLSEPDVSLSVCVHKTAPVGTSRPTSEFASPSQFKMAVPPASSSARLPLSSPPPFAEQTLAIVSSDSTI